MSEMKSQFKKSEGASEYTIWRPEIEGDTLCAIFKETIEVKTESGEVFDSHVFTDLLGEVYRIGSTAVIDREVALHDSGTLLKIAFEGKRKNPKTSRFYNAFLIESFDGDSIPENMPMGIFCPGEWDTAVDLEEAKDTVTSTQ